MQHWKTISLTNGWAWTELHSPVSRSQPHYSSKEVQLWRGLQNADRLARGKLAGKVGTGATLQHYRHQLSSRALVKGVTCATACPAVKWHYSPTSATLTQNGHIPFHIQSFHAHWWGADAHRPPNESITSQIICCCRREKLITCSRGNKNSSRLLKWWRVWS